MRWLYTFALILLAIASFPATAQVHRCKDSSGQFIFSDKPCDTGQTGGLIERQKSDRAIHEERMQAYMAEAKKQNRYAAEHALERQVQSQALPEPYWDQPPQKEYAERLAERNAGVRSNLTPIATAPRQKDRADRQPQPTNFTNCNSGFCTDNRGRLYHRQGPNLLISPTGQACHRSGAFWNCN